MSGRVTVGNGLLRGLFVCLFAALVAAPPAFPSQSPFFLDTHNQLGAASFDDRADDDAHGGTARFR
jgi:hypothetical protein